MISMVVPFWKRGSTLKANLAQLKKFYPIMALEILIVDDGSPEPAIIDDQYPWPVSIIRLSPKDFALNPSVPFNIGVAKASGDIIAITNPEVIHREPILARMREELEALGPSGYVCAACWDTEKEVWYCHSHLCPPGQKMGRARIPSGAGFHFLAMFYRSFYEEIGGFSEEYRDGQGFEDNDFLWKLHHAGASFRILDDCITDHVACERCEWPKGGHQRNKQIFESRWQI